MEKAFQKFLKQIILKDYPMYADVHVQKVDNPFRFGGGYEVFLVILQDEWDKIKDTDIWYKVRSLIYDLSKYMDINIEIVKGSYFCIKCDKIIFKGQCNHINIKNISGTEFRDCLSKKIFFKYADIDLQKYVFKLREKLFVE